MESINNGNLASSNHISPTRRPPLSNDITQFLVNTSSSSSSQKSPVNMNKSVASGSGTEKKNCNVKKVTISDDIEIVEEDSDGEEEEDVLSDVSTVVESPTKSVTSAAVFEKANQEDIVDSTSAGRTPLSNDITQFLSPINVNKNFDGREKKNSKVKKVIIDDDIEMVEEDSEVEEEDVEESIDSPSKSVESIVALEKEHHGSSSSEKKKCKVKKTIISDDIEFVEEESEEEEEVVSTAEVSANSPNKLVTTSDAISRNSNQDHIISTNNVSISDVPFDMPRKIQMIKRTEIDEDICMTEAASDVEDFDISEPFNTTETSATLSNLNISRNDENGSMIDHSSNISFLTPSSTGYQEVPSSAWNYGYDSLGRFQKRIIVMDLNDKKYAHEYGVYGGGSIRCLGCYRVRHSYRPAKFDNQKKLFVPTNHLCTPKLYAEIKEEQEKFAAKNNRSENSVSSRSKRSRINNLVLKEDSDASLNDTRQRDSNNDNPQGDADNDNHDDPQNDADNDNPQGDAYDVDNWNDFLQAPSPPSTVNSVVSAALPIQTPSPPNSVRSNSPSNYSTSDIQFYHPSGKFLQICAEKLELNYALAAYGFWARINIDIIKPTATPQSTFLVNNQKMSGFASLSLLFTGSEDSALEIKSNLNKYFLQNSLHIGDALGQNLSQAFNPKVVETISSDDLNEIHFVSFTRCLQCRCVLFDNGRWKRYGKWYNYELETYVPIVLMEKKNGKYSPIFRI